MHIHSHPGLRQALPNPMPGPCGTFHTSHQRNVPPEAPAPKACVCRTSKPSRQSSARLHLQMAILRRVRTDSICWVLVRSGGALPGSAHKQAGGPRMHGHNLTTRKQALSRPDLPGCQGPGIKVGRSAMGRVPAPPFSLSTARGRSAFPPAVCRPGA